MLGHVQMRVSPRANKAAILNLFLACPVLGAEKSSEFSQLTFSIVTGRVPPVYRILRQVTISIFGDVNILYVGQYFFFFQVHKACTISLKNC